MRLINADVLKAVFKEKSSEAVCGVELCKAIISQIDNQPTVDAIPVELIKDLHKEAIEYRDLFDSFWQAPAWDRADNQAIGINSVLQVWEDRHG